MKFSIKSIKKCFKEFFQCVVFVCFGLTVVVLFAIVLVMEEYINIKQIGV